MTTNRQSYRLEEQLTRTLHMLHQNNIWPIAIGRSGGFHIPNWKVPVRHTSSNGQLSMTRVAEVSLWDYRGVPGAWAYRLHDRHFPCEFFPEAPLPEETAIDALDGGPISHEEALAVVRELGVDVDALAARIRATVAAWEKK